MAKAIADNLPDLSAWTAETLRVTAYHQLGPQKDDHGWWETLVGLAPESKTLRPREGGYEVKGSHSGAVLVLKADLARFDWLLTPAISPVVEFPSIGSLPDALNMFLPIVLGWIVQAPPVHRLAFGAVIHRPVEDRITGYKALAPYLPYIELDPESTDFTYSINRARKADAFGGMRINRLSKWQVGQFQAIRVALLPGQGGTRADQMPEEGFHGLRIELDINTDAERIESLPKDQLPALCEHLVNLGKEIVQKGDIK